MATAGEVSITVNTRSVCLFADLAVAAAAPTLATQGVPVPHVDSAAIAGLGYRERPPLEATLVIKGAGTGVLTFTGGRLWGYHTASAKWYPLGTGTDADKGKINGGVALGEVSADNLVHAEPVLFLGHFDRVYLEGTPAGTNPLFEAWLITPRCQFPG